MSIKSLNSKHPDFYLEELEKRLETDPLSSGGAATIIPGME